MEKSTIYSSAPKPPKQIRVEEDPVEPKVEEQVLPEKKEGQPATITVMHPTVSNNTVVKLGGEKPQELVLDEKTNEGQTVNEPTENLAPAEGAKPYEVLTTEAQPETEPALAQTPDPEKESTEEQIELGEIETTGDNADTPETTIETETTQEQDPEKYSTEEQVELGEIDTTENIADKPETITETEATQDEDPEKGSVEEQLELAEIEAKINDAPNIETTKGEEKIATEEPYNIEFETTIEEASKYVMPEQLNNEGLKALVEIKNPVERVSKSSKNKPEAENEFENLKIPGDDELFQRQYYTMGEVATMFHANQSQIRFWENEFDILQPKKNKKGDRYFRPEDVKNLQVIHHLLRNRRFTIEGAREYLKSNKQRTQDTVAAIASLGQLKSFLTELKASL